MSLRLDWCSYQAAKYAVENWHYSKTMPTGKDNCIGVWEDSLFIGVIVFGTGASSNLGTPYNLLWSECCELVRVALTNHLTPVSQIVSIALKLLKRQNPKIRLCVSFADPFHNHLGVIYQAGNWIFTGVTGKGEIYRLANGRLAHPRRFTGTGWNAPKPIPVGAIKLQTPGKYRYLYPLDEAMRKQIEPLRKPYPKKVTGAGSIATNAIPLQGVEGGLTPTPALQ